MLLPHILSFFPCKASCLYSCLDFETNSNVPSSWPYVLGKKRQTLMFPHLDCMCWGKKDQHLAWKEVITFPPNQPEDTRMRGRKLFSRNGCRKRKEIANWGYCSQNTNEQYDVVWIWGCFNSYYGVVLYAAWFIKMKDCTMLFEEAEMFP